MKVSVSTVRILAPVCFELPSHYEIKAGGRKLIGSAQMRRKGALLQHGTFPLGGDVARICDVLALYGSEAEREAQKQRVRASALSLAQATGTSSPWPEVASAIERGFADALDVLLLPRQLSAAEQARASVLKSGTLRQSRVDAQAVAPMKCVRMSA